MYAVSAEFLREISGSHTAVSRLDVLQGGGRDSFDITDGNTTFDFDASTRRGISLSIPSELSYDEMVELLNPMRSVFEPWRGVRFEDGTEELVPLGRYYMKTLTVSADDGGLVFDISGFDASSRCMRGLVAPLSIPHGSKYLDAIVPLLRRALPEIEVRVTDTQWRTPAIVFAEDKVPWTEARKLSTSNGHDLWVARDGVADTASRPMTAADVPVASFEHGVNATFWEPERAFDADEYPNVIVVTGTAASSGSTVRGVAWNNDPRSPTYRYGDYGERGETYNNEYVTSSAQAAAMARSILARRLGLQDEVTFSCVPNPALDEADTIEVTHEQIGLYHERMLISYIEHPLLAEGECTIRARRGIITGEELPV